MELTVMREAISLKVSGIRYQLESMKKNLQKRTSTRVVWIVLAALMLSLTVMPAWPSHPSQGIGSPLSVSEKTDTFKPKTDNASSCDSIPLLYKLYWVGAISMVVLLIVYFFFLYKKEKYQLVEPLIFLLIFLALSLYLMEQGHVFSGYFDPARHLFVPGYHEANDIGFLRFIYKLTLGVALCVYGFITFLARQKK